MEWRQRGKIFRQLSERKRGGMTDMDEARAVSDLVLSTTRKLFPCNTTTIIMILGL